MLETDVLLVKDVDMLKNSVILKNQKTASVQFFVLFPYIAYSSQRSHDSASNICTRHAVYASQINR